ncbi:MAG: hypothetical protein ABEH88_02610 [Halobacteriales archaeon]
MSDRSASFLDGLRRPEYTGENRCVPCTIVNTLIAVLGSAVVSLGAPALGVASTAALALGFAVLVSSSLLIYLRGYLVPGTPELTKQYLPRQVLAVFGKDPVADRTGTETADGEHTAAFDEEAFAEAVEEITERHERAVDPETFLEEVGVIAHDGDDYRLVGRFADAVKDRMVTYREESVGIDLIATLFDTTAEEVEELDREYPAYRIGVRVRKWPSEGAWIADVATHEALVETTDRWPDLPLEQRVDMLAWLRGLHPACPMCDGEIRFSDDVIESCCGRFEVTTIACADCGERLREFDPRKVGNREDLKGITP